MAALRIGVVGYSAQKFDTAVARRALNNLLDQASEGHGDVVVVSGLTDLGIPAIAYRIARQRGWMTSGVACSKANAYACFPVDEVKIVGEDWGDEMETFLGECDVLVRAGGGAQSFAEVAAFKARGGKVYEFDLPALAG